VFEYLDFWSETPSDLVQNSIPFSNPNRKTLEQKFIFQIGTLHPIGINEHFSFY